jgi:hypothetical protein
MENVFDLKEGLFLEGFPFLTKEEAKKEIMRYFHYGYKYVSEIIDKITTFIDHKEKLPFFSKREKEIYDYFMSLPTIYWAIKLAHKNKAFSEYVILGKELFPPYYREFLPNENEPMFQGSKSVNFLLFDNFSSAVYFLRDNLKEESAIIYNPTQDGDLGSVLSFFELSGERFYDEISFKEALSKMQKFEGTFGEFLSENKNHLLKQMVDFLEYKNREINESTLEDIVFLSKNTPLSDGKIQIYLHTSPYKGILWNPSLDWIGPYFNADNFELCLSLASTIIKYGENDLGQQNRRLNYHAKKMRKNKRLIKECDAIPKFSPSSYLWFSKCAKAYEIYGYSPKLSKDKEEILEKGRVFHKIMEIYFSKGNLEEILSTLSPYDRKLAEAIMKKLQYTPFFEKPVQTEVYFESETYKGRMDLKGEDFVVDFKTGDLINKYQPFFYLSYLLEENKNVREFDFYFFNMFRFSFSGREIDYERSAKASIKMKCFVNMTKKEFATSLLGEILNAIPKRIQKEVYGLDKEVLYFLESISFENGSFFGGSFLNLENVLDESKVKRVREKIQNVLRSYFGKRSKFYFKEDFEEFKRELRENADLLEKYYKEGFPPSFSSCNSCPFRIFCVYG